MNNSILGGILDTKDEILKGKTCKIIKQGKYLNKSVHSLQEVINDSRNT